MPRMNKRKVICKDIEGKNYEVSVEGLSFRPSVYGIILKKNKVLLSKQWNGYDFPGGGVSIGESIKEALKREIKEETGLDVSVGKVIACENSFFKYPPTGKFVQAILMYYLCEIVGGKITTSFFDKSEKQYADKPEWIDLDDIEKIKFHNSVDSIKIIKEANVVKKT